MRVKQRCEYAMFVRGAMPGTKIMRVVGVNSVRNGANSTFLSNRFHAIEKFVLAVIAAVGLICHVERIVELVGFDKFVADAGGMHELGCLLAVMAGKARRERGDRGGPFAERVIGCPREIGRIRASG